MNSTTDNGYDIRIRKWPLDYVHGLMPLGAASEAGRAVGPDGERIGWLDTETTGLAGGTGTYVFLIGLGTVDDGEFILTQYFLRDLAGEAQMLQAVGDHLRRFDALVTFNGTRFDLPLLQTRFLLSRMRPSFDPEGHLDVMTFARRLWYRRLGGYSMSLLEQAVLKVERFVDVPGWQIPSLYVQYLHTGDDECIEPVFAHNAQDLLSLVALHGVTGDVLTYPERTRITIDWSGLGHLLEARGNREAAADCFRTALDEERDASVRLRTATALARHYRRAGQTENLVDLWEGEIRTGVLPAWLAMERLAMVWEWQMADPARALTLAERALSRLNGADGSQHQRLLHRRDRLLRKVV